MHDLFRLREIHVKSCHFHLTLSNVTVTFLRQIQIPCFWVTSSLLSAFSLCHLKARALLASLPGALARHCTFTLNNLYSSSICCANSQKVMILFSLHRCSLSESQSPCTITRCSMDGFVSQEEVPNLSDQAHAEHSLRVAKSKLSCADNQELTTVIHKGKREVLWLCTYT